MHAPDAVRWIPIERDILIPPAFAALGVPVRTLVHLYPDSPTQGKHRQVSYQLGETSVADPSINVAQLITAYQGGTLTKDYPNNPFLIGLLGLQTWQVLRQWLRDGGERPCTVRISGSELTRLMPPTPRALQADLFGALDAPEVSEWSVDGASAAIVCGFPLINAKTRGIIQISDKMVFYGGATIQQLHAAERIVLTNPETIGSIALPGYAPGCHPFLYAYAAILQAKDLTKRADAADPTLHLRAKSTSQSALVSLSIMDGNARFADLTAKHLR